MTLSDGTIRRPMNVVFIHPSANQRSGGIVNAGLSYIEGLVARGHKVEVWTASPAFADGAKSIGVVVRLDHAFRSFLALCAKPSAFVQAITAIRCADVLIHNNGRLWPLACIAKPARHFVVFHNDSVGIRGFFRNWLAISSAQFQRLCDLGAQRKPWNRSVGRILNGLAPEFRGSEPPWKSTLQRSPIVGFLAEIRRKKGLDVLLEAAALLKARGLEFRLVIGGDGADLQAHKVMAEKLGLGPQIEWRGWVSDRVAFMDELDVFCLPSRIEPFGIVMVEAMARGVPVVATRTDGPLEVIAESEAGLLVAIDDAAELADALAKLMTNKDIRDRMGQNGHHYADREFRPTAIGQKIELAVASSLKRPEAALRQRKAHG